MASANSDQPITLPQESIQIANPNEPQPFPIDSQPTKLDLSSSLDPILNRSPKSPETSPMRRAPRAPRFRPKPHSCITKQPSKAPPSFVAKDMPLPPPDRFVSKPTRSNFLRAGRVGDHRPTSPIPLLLENKPPVDPGNQMILPKFSALGMLMSTLRASRLFKYFALLSSTYDPMSNICFRSGPPLAGTTGCPSRLERSE